MVATPLSAPQEIPENPCGPIAGARQTRIGLVTADALEPARRSGELDTPLPPAEFSAADVSAVHHYVERRVPNRADAADIAQEALLVGCAKRLTCRSQNQSGWLLAIARHLIIDHYRSMNRRKFLDIETLSDKELASHAPGAIHENRERLTGWLDGLTRQLPLAEQIAVLLADAYAYRDRDSASVLHMSLPSFKLLLHGARAHLRSFFHVDGAATHSSPSASAGLSRHGESDFAGRGHPPALDRPCRTGVACRLGKKELEALRDRLVEGFGL